MGRLSTYRVAGCVALSSVFFVAAAGQAQQRVLGLDVSAWQSNLTQSQWATFRNNSTADREFVFIRSSRGGTTGTHPGGGPGGGGDDGTLSRRYDDPYFRQNITYATKAGLLAGSYHFARADVAGNTGADEANHFLEMAGPWMRPGYLLPVIDLEAGSGLSQTALSNWVIEFANTITNATSYGATGLKPIIYANSSYARDEVNSSVASLLPNLWLARPTSGDPLTTEPPTPSGFTNPYGQWNNHDPQWTFWQYKVGTGVPGYSGNLDQDAANGGIEFVKDFLVPAVLTTNASGDWSDLAMWNSGIDSAAPTPGAGQPAVVGPAWTTLSPSDLEAKPVARAPGVDVPLQGILGANDTVILDRPAANPTITLSSGAYTIRKLYAKEALNLTGGSLNIAYVPSADSTPFSAQFSAAVSVGGGASLSVHTLNIDATRTFTIGGDSTVALNTINLGRHVSTPAKINVNGNVNFSPLADAAAVINATGSGSTGTIDLTGATRVINVANGAQAIDLSINVPVVNGGLTKAGAGWLQLNGANSYSGDTTIEAGRLILGSKSLADSANVMLLPGSSLQLDHSGTPDLVNALFIGGILQDAGTWGADGSGAQYTSPLLAGTGVLQVNVGPSAGDFNRDGYVNSADLDEWADGYGSGYTGSDFLAWQRDVGNGVLDGVVAAAAVPEPGTFALAAVALGAAVGAGCRRRRAIRRA